MTLGSAIFALTIACIIGGYVWSLFGANDPDDSDDEGSSCPLCMIDKCRVWQESGHSRGWFHVGEDGELFACREQEPEYSADVVPFPLRRHA